MEISVGELARRMSGIVHGDETVLIGNAQSIAQAEPGDITFAIDELNLRLLKTARPGAILITATFLEHAQQNYPGRTWIVVKDPMGSFIEALVLTRPQRERSTMGISPLAVIAPSAVIGPDCNVYPGACIGEEVVIGTGCDIHPGVVISADCRLGDHCTVYPNAVLYPQTVIGNRVIIHASAVLGADGFGYRFQQGRYKKIPQLGNVEVADDVEIGACTTIDRAMIGSTKIGEGTKLDNLVMIGHNCEVGKHNAFASGVGLAGSVTTGDHVVCAGQVGIADHVHIGDKAVIGAKSGVHRDMEGGKTYLGAPATSEQDQFRILMALRKLPEMRKQFREFELQVAELTRRLGDQTEDARDDSSPSSAVASVALAEPVAP